MVPDIHELGAEQVGEADEDKNWASWDSCSSVMPKFDCGMQRQG